MPDQRTSSKAKAVQALGGSLPQAKHAINKRKKHRLTVKPINRSAKR